MELEQFILKTLLELQHNYPGKVQLVSYPRCSIVEGSTVFLIELPNLHCPALEVRLSCQGGLWKFSMSAPLVHPFKDRRQLLARLARQTWPADDYTLAIGSSLEVTLQSTFAASALNCELQPAMVNFIAAADRLNNCLNQEN